MPVPHAARASGTRRRDLIELCLLRTVLLVLMLATALVMARQPGFVAALPAAGSVLDLGCGAGDPVALAMVDRGLNGPAERTL